MKRNIATSVAICAFLAAAVPMQARWPTFHPVSEKYRDAGVKPATGRSGVAALEIRALRGKSDTVIEVSTGELDSATVPAGMLDKVQIKIFGEDGTLKVTDNYKRGVLSGGSGSFSYDWPARGQRVQVQANVGGIEPRRTDVVTVETPVMLRPDLAVTIPLLPQALVNVPVGITATVREHNGDVGARANCVLKVDDQIVDHADGIWVDAGDHVDCAFTHVFPTVGLKQVKVEVTNVVPGDFDDSDNAATAAIEILPPTAPVQYRLEAGDIETDDASSWQGHSETIWPHQPTDILDWTREERTTAHTQYYDALLKVTETRPFPFTIKSSLRMDGAVLHHGTATIATPVFSDSDETHSIACGWEPDDNSLPWYSACTGWSLNPTTGERSEFTTTEVQMYASSTVYVSLATDHFWHADGSRDDTYWFSEFDTTESPVHWPRFGEEVLIASAFTDGNGVRAEVERAVQLIVTTVSTGPDQYCGSDDPRVNPDGSIEQGTYCVTYTSTLTGKQGISTNLPQ